MEHSVEELLAVLQEIIDRPQWLGQAIAARYLRGENWKSTTKE